jgi:RNA polymerase II subunit A-like phosphatase
MASEATGLTLPTSLSYPLRITQITAQPGISISRGSPIFEYTFTSATSQKALDRNKRGLPPQDGDKDAREGDMVGSWDSELEGEVERVAEWIKVGAVIDRVSAG